MASMMNKLDSRESRLLMYLAGELPEQDRLEMRRLLEADASLREDLERLRAAEASVMSALDAAEAAHSSPAADEAAIRRVLREMKKRQVELAARPTPVEAQPAWRWPRWSYGVAAVAAAIIVLIGLWGMDVFEKKGGPIVDPRNSPGDVDLIGQPYAPRHPSQDDPLDLAMQHAEELVASRENDPLLLMMLSTR